MKTLSPLCTVWHQHVKEFFTGVHGHQSKTLALFVFGAIKANSIVIHRVAEELLAEGRPPDADGATKQQFDQWVKSRAETSGRQISDDEAKDLFVQFRSWLKQGKNPAGR